jgi:outer membrane protein OmpA-like peptidoglycan-associated protein
MLGLLNVIWAQDTPSGTAATQGYFKFQARLKVGLGQTFTALPMKFEDAVLLNAYDSNGYRISKSFSGLKNNVLKTKWGIYGGGNFDFYFHPNFGVGLDVDYFNNKLKFVTPSALKDFMNTNSSTYLSESNRKNQSLIFIGVGPSFKLFTNEHWDVDLNLRGGLSMLNMGSLTVRMGGLPEFEQYRLRDSILSFDYSKTMNVFGAKIGLYGNYWFNSFIGITMGVDFIHSFVSASKINSDAAYVFKYKDPQNFLNAGGTLDEFQYFQIKNYLDSYHPSTMNVNHFSASVGVVFRVVPVAAPKGKNKDIIVLVKDSLTSIPVADVDVSLRDKKGTVLRTKKTESNGKVTFENVEPGDYIVSGAKGELLTTTAKIERAEFNKRGKSIYKELLLNDPRFILAGVTVQCKASDKAIGRVNIELTNKTTGKVLTAVSDEQGNFSFNLEQNTDYSIVGNKDGYFSGIQEITTKGLDRSKTLYVKLVLCVEELKPDQIFVLPIYYDFDKCNIRKDASEVLNNLVDLMRKYPKMEIELSSHTDQRGTDAYNDKLSQCRAESAVDYIIGKGISKNRIVAKGYGKHKLIEDCTKVAGCPTGSTGDCPCHQLNRRTEVKIIKM